MPAALDITGKRCGRLVAIEVVGATPNGRIWRCRCACGRETQVNTSDFRLRKVRSCGCLRSEAAARTGKTLRLGPGVARFNQVVLRYVQRARRSKRSWALTRDEAFALLTGDCHYCGAKPAMVSRAQPGRWGRFVHNGIDRVDNAVGYERANCVSCCSTCNYMKGTFSFDAFVEQIDRIHRYFRIMRKEQAHGKAAA